MATKKQSQQSCGTGNIIYMLVCNIRSVNLFDPRGASTVCQSWYFVSRCCSAKAQAGKNLQKNVLYSSSWVIIPPRTSYLHGRSFQTLDLNVHTAFSKRVTMMSGVFHSTFSRLGPHVQKACPHLTLSQLKMGASPQRRKKAPETQIPKMPRGNASYQNHST